MKDTTTELSPNTLALLKVAIAPLSNVKGVDDSKKAIKQNYVLIQSLITAQLVTQKRLGLSVSCDEFLEALTLDAKINFERSNSGDHC